MKIALGSVQFGLKYGISNLSGPTSKSQIKKILEIAKDLGVDIIDTATVYGNSELLLGNSNVKNFKVVTKIPTLKPNILNIEKWVNDKVYSSIKKLKIESLYGVLIHNSNNFFGDKGKILLEALQSLKKDGKIKKIGISIYDTNTFCGRLKHDWSVIKKNLTSKIVYKYYLFWFISGFMPSFSGMDYYMIMDVYKITPI